jgi:hypothetical protein
MRTHNKDKPYYTCQFCGKFFNDTSNRRRHEGICLSKHNSKSPAEERNQLDTRSKSPANMGNMQEKKTTSPAKKRNVKKNQSKSPSKKRSRSRSGKRVARENPKKTVKGSDRLCGQFGNLDDSNSENDISLHSSRTPVSNYLGPASRRGATPMLAVTKTPILPTDDILTTEDGTDIGYQEHAYIHKKVAVNSKNARKKKQLQLKPALKMQPTAQSSKVQAQSMVESTTIIRNNTLASPHKDKDNDAEDWYEEDEEESSLSCDPPSALLSMYKKRKQQNKIKRDESIYLF